MLQHLLRTLVLLSISMFLLTSHAPEIGIEFGSAYAQDAPLAPEANPNVPASSNGNDGGASFDPWIGQESLEVFWLFEESWFYVALPLVALIFTLGGGLLLHQGQVSKARKVFPQTFTTLQLWMPTILLGAALFAVIGIGYVWLLYGVDVQTSDAAYANRGAFGGAFVGCALITALFFTFTTRSN